MTTTLRNVRNGCRIALLLASVGFASSVEAASAPKLFATLDDSNQDPGSEVQFPTTGVQNLYLYMEAGNASTYTTGGQVPCETGLGDEVCAIQIELSASGDLTFGSFSPDPGLGGAGRYDYNDADPALFRLARANPVAGGDLGVVRLGSLQVDAQGDGQISLSSSLAVDARLEAQNVIGGLLAVPEPSTISGLVVGGLMLGLLDRRRRRG